ncbi:MAG TPA: M14 family zinc carboxypeptidase [Nocardioides sp.]|nr:M14 family zinc carboxypeptidase [Nocardioides sp.]
MRRSYGPAAALMALVMLVPLLLAPPSAEATTAAKEPAVNGRRIVGESVNGRAIVAYHLGEPGRAGVPTVVLMSTMHGNEPDTRHILFGLKDGRPLVGIDLWIVPTYNPDGLAAGTRKNAHGVDLNRNFPFRWKDLDGSYESGPKPASEPETRAMMRFLRKVRPDYILSFHQPLRGVDTDTKRPRFARRVADRLHLPAKTLDCGSVCHGTMTMWFNHRFRGTALTVEYGAHPKRRHLRGAVPRQVLSIFDAGYGRITFDPPGP